MRQIFPDSGENHFDMESDLSELSNERVHARLAVRGVTTTAILGVLYTVAGKFQPLPQDIYRYDCISLYCCRLEGTFQSTERVAFVGWDWSCWCCSCCGIDRGCHVLFQWANPRKRDQSFWDDIEDGPRPLGPFGLQQWAVKDRKWYTQQQLDEVRIEVADYLQTLL